MSRLLTPRAILGGTFQILLFPLVLFFTAGTLAWPAAWIFLLLFYSFVFVTVRRLLIHQPALLEERMSMFKPNPRGPDKLFLFLLPLGSLWFVFMALDAGRFHWSFLPPWLQAIGALLLIGALILIYRTFMVNPYLTPTVRLQDERGHSVVSSGPYHYVRHPMYTGFHLFFLGTTLLLGSWVGLVFSVFLIGLFAWRAMLEEHFLQQELPGYVTYMQRVHARFIPYVW